MDSPQFDTTEYPEPSDSQRFDEEVALCRLDELKKALERCTIPQQRRVIGKIAHFVYHRDVVPAGYERQGPA